MKRGALVFLTLLLAFLGATACGHSEAALRDERAKSRRYRDAYETQAAELAQLKARMANLEKKACASP